VRLCVLRGSAFAERLSMRTGVLPNTCPRIGSLPVVILGLDPRIGVSAARCAPVRHEAHGV